MSGICYLSMGLREIIKTTTRKDLSILALIFHLSQATFVRLSAIRLLKLLVLEKYWVQNIWVCFFTSIASCSYNKSPSAVCTTKYQEKKTGLKTT